MDLAIHMKAVLIGAVFAIVSRKYKLMLKVQTSLIGPWDMG